MESGFLLKCKCGFNKFLKNDDKEFANRYEIKQNCNCSTKKFKCPNCGYAIKTKKVRFN